MVRRCDKCGQTVLETDAICWHCGVTQTGNKGQSSSSNDGREDVTSVALISARNTAVAEELPLSITAVAAYAFLTIFCLMALLLILRFLSQQPVFLINPEISREHDWQVVTDDALQFTLELPPDWTYIENENKGFVEPFLTSMNDLQAQTVFQILEENIAGDIVPHMLVQSEEHPAFLLIVSSQGLQSATSTQLMALIERTDWEILRIDEVELMQNENRINASIYLDANGVQMRCTMQTIPSEVEQFVLIGCAPTNDFPQVAEPIAKMLAIFQPLVYQ